MRSILSIISFILLLTTDLCSGEQQPSTSSANCGPNFGGQSCPPGQCCDSNGNCGADFDFCDPSFGCQSDYGVCLPIGLQCAPIFGDAPCTVTGFCCGQNGYCGNTADYCDIAQGCIKECWGQSASTITSTFGAVTLTVPPPSPTQSAINNSDFTTTPTLTTTSAITLSLSSASESPSSISLSSSPSSPSTMSSSSLTSSPSSPSTMSSSSLTFSPIFPSPTSLSSPSLSSTSTSLSSTSLSSTSSISISSSSTSSSSSFKIITLVSTIYDNAGGDSQQPATRTVSNQPQAEGTIYVAELGGRCGPDNFNAICRLGQCCSKWGFCGSSEMHCASPNCIYQCW